MIGFPIGLAYFVFYVTAGALGIGLSILGIGLLILFLLVLAAWGLAHVERGLANTLLGADVAPVPPTAVEEGGWPWVKSVFGNPVTWKGLRTRSVGQTSTMLAWRSEKCRSAFRSTPMPVESMKVTSERSTTTRVFPSSARPNRRIAPPSVASRTEPVAGFGITIGDRPPARNRDADTPHDPHADQAEHTRPGRQRSPAAAAIWYR